VQALLTEFLLQPEATTGTAQPGEPTHEPTTSSPGLGSEFQFVLLPLMLGLFYFLMIRPQQKRQREVDDLLKSLKRGDVVRTSGGIRGEITDLTETDATLLIAEKVKINVLRSHISSKAATEAALKAQNATKDATKDATKEKP
jgi:preprotein translocase subunit YajC